MARLKTMARLKIGFMGTAEFAVPTLRALNDAGHDIVCVYTQPPRPAGRGHKPRDTPVHDAATGLGLALRTPASFRGDDERRDFAGLGLDACVVVAYGLILPRPVLDAPRLGCLNLHPSLLPRWRGPAPIPRCIEAGDSETGVCAMVMDEGVDTGPVLMVERVPVAAHASAGDLHDDLAARGARLMVAALDGLAAGRLTATPQAADGATHAAKLDRAEGRLDWRRPAAELDRRVRAFSPWPGAHAEVGGKPLKILAAECVAGAGAPGALLHGGFHVACGDGVLRLIRVQAPGRAATDGDAFLRGARLGPGTILA